MKLEGSFINIKRLYRDYLINCFGKKVLIILEEKIDFYIIF